MFKAMSTRYYLGRLWKVSWVALTLRGRVLRLAKHYERRTAIGQPWQHVRSIVEEA